MILTHIRSFYISYHISHHMRHRGVDADGRIAAAILNRSYDQIFDIIVQLALETCALCLGRGGLRHEIKFCSQAVFGAACVCTNYVGGEKRVAGVEIISRLVASLRRSAAAAGIKYLDTGTATG